MKTLLLPLAIEGDRMLREEDWLSRQVPILLRNIFEQIVPGRLVASPLATEMEGRRHWVVQRKLWAPTEAARFARDRGFGRVVYGRIFGEPGIGSERKLEICAVDAADAGLVLSGRLSGDLLRVVRAAVEKISGLAELNAGDAARLFNPGTTNAAAFEHYLRGLDVLLALRSPGVRISAPDTVLHPFEEALRLDPAFDEALTAGLSCALQVGEAEDARIPLDAVLRTLESWRALRRNDVRPYAVGAEVLVARDRPVDALRWLESGLKSVQPPHHDLLRRSADILCDLGRNDAALEAYAACHRDVPEAPVLERMANLAIMLSRHQEADRYLAELLAADPRRLDLLVRRALVLEKLGRHEEMWNALARLFIEDVPPSAADLTKINVILSRSRPSERFVERVRAWYPPGHLHPEERLLFARTLRLAGAPIEAGFCLSSIRPESLDRENRATLSREKLNLVQADFDADFARLARDIVDGHEPVEDTTLLDLARKREPDFWPASFLHGLVLSRRGDFEQSIDVFDFVLNLQPDNDVVWYTRGLQFEHLGRDVEAKDSFEHAIRINAKESDYHTHLALAHARRGDKAAAREALEVVLRLRPEHPDNERIRGAIERL